MARRRLAPPDPGMLEPAAPPPLESKAMFPMGAPPIARVAGESAAAAALAELSGELARARAEGRLVQALPLAAVEAGYLLRDRVGTDEEELSALVQSIAARGQQVPIEVVALEPDAAGQPRYGLLTGWRRLTALRRLAEETGEPQFATVLALLRQPESAAEAYLAMIEENEIRVGLSYYERARIVARATERGVFPSTSVALGHLFASASRAKRSKIGSFLRIHAVLDDRLRFAPAISERLGLALVKALDSGPRFGEGLRARLAAKPASTAAEEIAALEEALRRPDRAAAPKPPTEEIAPGLTLTAAPGRLTLAGPGVTPALQERLRRFLSEAGAEAVHKTLPDQD